MDGLGSADILMFEGFRFDRRGGCLFQSDLAGVATPVALGSRALRLLGLLVDRQGELVTKDVIMEAVWPGRVVEEANLNVQISKVRHDSRVHLIAPFPSLIHCSQVPRWL
jgi:DNA-binding winged helix-turn-helix (wHTH) protein